MPRRVRTAAACLLLLGACAVPGPVTAPPPPGLGWEMLGVSREGRPILAAATGTGGPAVYLIGSVHGDELEGRRALRAIATRLAGEPVQLRVVWDLNPDGSARGSRENAAGVDLNRNWPASNFASGEDRGPAPLSEPETAAVHADLLAFAPQCVVVLHTSRRGPFVNYDGPARGLAERFAAAAGPRPAWDVVARMGYPTPGSLGSFAGVDRQTPILTLEFARDMEPRAAAASLESGLQAVFARLAGGP